MVPSGTGKKLLPTTCWQLGYDLQKSITAKVGKEQKRFAALVLNRMMF